MEIPELKNKVLDFLNAHRKAVLATCDSNVPITSLMLYATDNGLNLFSGAKKSSEKWKNLESNPRVSITVADGVADPLRAVEIRGEVSLVPDSEVRQTLEWFQGKNPSAYYVKNEQDFGMFRVVPKMIRWMDASSGKLLMEHLNF